MRRREFLAVAGTVAVTGCLGSDGYDADAVKSEAEQVPYDEMSEGDRIHVERGVVRQVQASDSSRYFIYTEQENGEWQNDVFGTWEGEQFEVDDEVEFWGVIEDFLETEEGRQIPEVAIVDMRSAG